MALKVVWDFIQEGEGWSEVYYTSNDNPSDYVTFNRQGGLDAASAAVAFVIARQQILTTTAFINHVRASKVGSPGITLSSAVNPLFGVGTYDGAGSAESFSKLLCRLTVGQTRRRTLWLGGIPETIIRQPQTYAPTDRFNDAMNTFRTLIVRSAYGLVGRPRVTDIPVAVPISLFLAANSGQTATVSPLVKPAGAGNTWYVIVRGVKNPRGWNGVHLAQQNADTPTIMRIGPTRRTMVTTPFWDVASGGTVQAYVPSAFSAFDSLIPERVVSRKVGRPFGSPRGRRA